tara:strand:- start:78 stop:602 length:525 start_codon:yes stop_codon:yes gene_type:complete
LIKITCKDEFFNSIINKLLLQKNLINGTNTDSFFVSIEIDIRENYLNLNCNGKKEYLSMPIDVNSFYSQILRIISDIKISKDEYDYYPYQRLLLKKTKKSLLSDIQNTIFSNLIISKSGINKDKLYGLIWKKDKDISINKLDTHLTNLKNQLKKDLGMNAYFQSQDKTLKLLIN